MGFGFFSFPCCRALNVYIIWISLEVLFFNGNNDGFSTAHGTRSQDLLISFAESVSLSVSSLLDISTGHAQVAGCAEHEEHRPFRNRGCSTPGSLASGVWPSNCGRCRPISGAPSLFLFFLRSSGWSRRVLGLFCFLVDDLLHRLFPAAYLANGVCIHDLAVAEKYITFPQYCGGQERNLL